MVIGHIWIAHLNPVQYTAKTRLQRVQNMAECGEVLRGLHHDGSTASPGQLEDDLCVGENVELGQRLDEDDGPAYMLEKVYVSLHHHGPDDVRLHRTIRRFLTEITQ